MKLIVCFDKNFGMLKQGRRPTRDEVVLKDLEEICKGKHLFITKGSVNMLDRRFENMHVCSDPMAMAYGTDAICFIEDPKYIKDIEMTDYLITYQWEKNYNCDTYFLFNLNGFTNIHNVKLKGDKHDIVTRTVYCK